MLQLMGVLPILPLLFPVLWVLLNAFGEARVLAEFSRASPAGLVSRTLTSVTDSSITLTAQAAAGHGRLL